jgi:transcriptional regulator with XRE-family HTH domain
MMATSERPTTTERLRNSFKDPEYADAYAHSALNSYIATQIKVIREQRGWTQGELAEKAGMMQPRIAVMEDVDYSSWSINTLWRLARAFHLRLKVSFEEFGTLPREVDSFTRSNLERLPLENDPFCSPLPTNLLAFNQGPFPDIFGVPTKDIWAIYSTFYWKPPTLDPSTFNVLQGQQTVEPSDLEVIPQAAEVNWEALGII